MAFIAPKSRSWKKDMLTAQQQCFVEHLLADGDFNAANAARKANYKFPNQAARQLLSKRHVAHEIGKHIKARADRLQWQADDVLNLLKGVLEANLVELYDDDGRITIEALKALPEETQRLINKVSVRHYTDPDTDEEIPYAEIEWMSKDRALELAMKHFGLVHGDLHLHVVSDEVKEQVILELFGNMDTEGDNVIDAEAVARIAKE